MAEYRTVTVEAELSNNAIEAEGSVSRSAIDAEAEAMRVVFAVSDYLVTLTLTDESQGVSDRTVSEILQAHSDGKRVLLQGMLGDVWFQVPVATIYQTTAGDDSLWAVQSYAVTLGDQGSTLLTLVFPWSNGSGSSFGIFANPLEPPTAETMEYDGNLDYSVGSIGAAVKAAYVKPDGGIPAADLAGTYAGAAADGAAAKKAQGLPSGAVDSTSTSTAFTATIPEITEYRNGIAVLLKNGVVTSAAGFTININGLGAKPVYNSMAAASAETTIFNINYTLLLFYDEDRVAGGCWVNYRGYNSDTNTIAYQVRTNNSILKTSDKCRYYKLFFTSADGSHWVPASADSTNSATSAKTVNQRPIDPFGAIAYTSATTSYAAEADIAAGTIWRQYNVTLGYSFNRTGAALTLTNKAPVYLKCAPQTNGSAIMDSTTPIVQALPTTNDGKIYIFLGIATGATTMELALYHPVYYHNGTGIRFWTGG